MVHVNSHSPPIVSSNPQLGLLSHLGADGFDSPLPELLPAAPQLVGCSPVAQLLAFPAREI